MKPFLTLLLLLCTFTLHPSFAQDDQAKESILIHLTQGPENPTVVALAFLIAKTAVEEGHKVTLFLAGDAVQVMRPGVLDNLQGLGTGNLNAHAAVLSTAGTPFFLSGMSSKSRGLTPSDISLPNVEFASPAVLLGLALNHDRMFVY